MPAQRTGKSLRRPRSGSDRLAVLRDNLERLAGGNMKKFSLDAGLGETFVRDVVRRGQAPTVENLAALAERHRLSVDRLLGLNPAQTDEAAPTIKVIGEVGAGKWHELDEAGQLDFEREDSPFPPDPRYPLGAQFDLVVRGSSINRFARDGMRLRCVDLIKTGLEVFDDDLVVVRKAKHGGSLYETTAKRIRRRGTMIELWPDSDDPKWQTPERIEKRDNLQGGDETSIIALVIWAYNPARDRRRR